MQRNDTSELSRRTAVTWLMALPAAAMVGGAPGLVAARTPQEQRWRATVYKRPGCGCCTVWVAHLQTHGFDVSATEEPNLAQIKQRLGVPSDLQSCHTAVVEGYVVEGHVPAGVIVQLLEQSAEVAGLAVPGMPIGSPGMEMEGQEAVQYDIMAFQRDGARNVYATR